jgi:hypothetical protein
MDRRFCNVIKHPDVADAQPVLRLAKPAEPLDATLADLRRLVSEVPVDGVRHQGALVTREFPKHVRRIWSHDDLERHFRLDDHFWLDDSHITDSNASDR